MAGHFLLRRFVLFVDYQNAYMQARRCFRGEAAQRAFGQFHPAVLGELIGGRLGADLHEVRVYRGLPHAVRDPRSFTAADRQIKAWERDARTTVVTRPLRYRGALPPEEKGIDVRLAVDFVAMALRGEYDVGVLMSHDSDLAPALEAVLELAPAVHVEVAAWAARRGNVNRLRIPGRRVWCHYLSAADYAAVADRRSYARP
jgi:uncharacterized LabA/DUF88 family protein